MKFVLDFTSLYDEVEGLEEESVLRFTVYVFTIVAI